VALALPKNLSAIFQQNNYPLTENGLSSLHIVLPRPKRNVSVAYELLWIEKRRNPSGSDNLQSQGTCRCLFSFTRESVLMIIARGISEDFESSCPRCQLEGGHCCVWLRSTSDCAPNPYPGMYQDAIVPAVGVFFFSFTKPDEGRTSPSSKPCLCMYPRNPKTPANTIIILIAFESA
jgi:hypothetical protein